MVDENKESASVKLPKAVRKKSKELFWGYFDYSKEYVGSSPDSKLYYVDNLESSGSHWQARNIRPTIRLTDEERKDFLEIMKEYGSLFHVEHKLYYPPADGFTQRDFIDWSIKNKGIRNSGSRGAVSIWKSNWRQYEIEEVIPKSLVSTHYAYETVNFFSTNSYASKRSDATFRYIELNEFVHRGADGQTFRDFLNTDSRVEAQAKSFVMTNYSPLTKEIAGDNKIKRPKFMEFGPKVNKKTRGLFLDLTKEDLIEVFKNFKNNPHLKANASNSHTYEYVRIFIEAGIKGEKLEEFPVLHHSTINNYITAKIASDFDYWYSKDNSLTTRFKEIFDKLSTAFDHSDPYCRIMSYLINKKAFDNLNAMEAARATTGLAKTRRWATEIAGEDMRAYLLNKIMIGEIEPEALLKLIAASNKRSVGSEEKVVKFTKDFDWSSINEIPSDWALGLFDTNKASLKEIYVMRFF